MITDRSDLTLQTPESFFSRFRVNMKVRHEVTAIHPEEKTVSVKNLETGEEFEESYDKLILSPGAKPTQPRLPGVGLDKLFTLRTVEDTFCIKDYINANIPNPLYWQVVASLDWSWQKTCESWGWMSPLSSVQNSL